MNIAECLFPCILFPFDFFLDNHNCPFPHCDVMPGPSHKARQLAWKYGRGAAWQSLIVNCCCVGMEVFQLNLNLPCQHGFNTEYVYRTLVIYIHIQWEGLIMIRCSINLTCIWTKSTSETIFVIFVFGKNLEFAGWHSWCLYLRIKRVNW